MGTYYLLWVPVALVSVACSSTESGSARPVDGGVDHRLPGKPPDVPEFKRVMAASSAQVFMDWMGTTPSGTVFATDVTSYNVYRDGMLLKSFDYAQYTTFNDTGLQPSTEFCYALSAVGDGGESAPSAPSCVTTFDQNDDSCGAAAVCKDCLAQPTCGYCRVTSLCQMGMGTGPSPRIGACPESNPPGRYWIAPGGGVSSCPVPANPACTNCIKACQGVSGCCTGCGCICQQQCTGPC